MRYVFLLLPFLYTAALAQQKEKTISVSCYVNPELYIQAGVIAQVSDKSGNVSCKGRYLLLHNKSANAFYYKNGSNWVTVRPLNKSIIPIAGSSTSSNAVYKLQVRYRPDVSGSLAAKLGNITEMNATTDRVKATEAAGGTQHGLASSKESSASTARVAKTSKPAPAEKSGVAAKPAGTASSSKGVATRSVAKTSTSRTSGSSSASRASTTAARAKTSSNTGRSSAASTQSGRSRAVAPAASNALGLRVDFGEGATGVGPNFKHKFNRKLAIDAALVFYEHDVVGLGAQLQQTFPARTDPGLNFYLGIGPNFLFWDDETAFALVPVAGIEYAIPRTPLNFSLDWRPSFYLTPANDVEAGRFGLSFRVAF